MYEKTKEQSKITSKPEDEAGTQERCLLMIQQSNKKLLQRMTKKASLLT